MVVTFTDGVVVVVGFTLVTGQAFKCLSTCTLSCLITSQAIGTIRVTVTGCKQSMQYNSRQNLNSNHYQMRYTVHFPFWIKCIIKCACLSNPLLLNTLFFMSRVKFTIKCQLDFQKSNKLWDVLNNGYLGHMSIL